MNDSETIQTFIRELGRLDDGDRAKLKRNAGRSINESRDVMGLFYNKLLRSVHVSEWEEEHFFLIATLFPFDKRRMQQAEEEAEAATETAAPSNRARSFGKSLHSVRSEKNASGLDRRVERLLDADAQQLSYYLRREVQFVANEGGRIDWGQLLQDVLRWDHPERYIQRNWARDYFTSQPANQASVQE